MGCEGEPAPTAPAATVSVVPSAAATVAPLKTEPPPPLLKEGVRCDRDELPFYRIDQAIDDLNRTFTGELALRLVNPSSDPIEELPMWLHPNVARELGATDHPASLEIEAVRGAGGEPLTFRRERPTLVWIKLVGRAAPGAAIELTIRYKGKFRRLGSDANDMFSQAFGSLGSLAGTAAPDYGLLAVGDGLLTAASAFPMVAPFREGEFDVAPAAPIGDVAYNGMARFEVRTVASKGLEIVTNLSDATAAASDADLSLTFSKGDCVRDFVLVAGRDLESRTKKVGETVVRSVFRKRDRTKGIEALACGASSLATFERLFGPYPYRELDIVEASLVGGAGGVEFSGMVLIAGMLYRPLGESSSSLAGLLGNLEGAGAKPLASLSSMLEFTVHHEVAHQYFAGIVGNDAHRHPSLDEPLAQYAAGLAYAERHGQEAAEQAMTHNVKLGYAAYRMIGGADRPVMRPTSSYKSNLEYAALVYGKAPYLYVALRDALGAELLHAALRSVIARYHFRIVTPEAWIAALELAAGPKGKLVRPLFSRWLEQTHGDADLGVDGSGDAVLKSMFSPEMVRQIREGLALLGLTPEQMLKSALPAPPE